MNTYLRSTQIIFQHCKFKKCGNGVCEMESVADEKRLYTYNFSNPSKSGSNFLTRAVFEKKSG